MNFVENNTDRGVIRIFIEEFYGSKFVECYLAIGMGVSFSLIKSGYCKPLYACICDEAVLIWTPIEKPFEGVTALVTMTRWNVYI